MTLPIITLGFRLIAGFTANQAGKPWSTHFDYKADDLASSPTELATLWDAAFQTWKVAAHGQATEPQDYWTTAADLLSITVYELDGSSAPVVVQPSTGAFGTAIPATSDIPPDLAAVATLRTADRGPRARGRQYWAPNAGLASSNGNVRDQLRVHLSSGLFDDFGQLTGSPAVYDLVVIGRTSEADPTPIARTVLNISCDEHWDVQRRRGAG